MKSLFPWRVGKESTFLNQLSVFPNCLTGFLVSLPIQPELSWDYKFQENYTQRQELVSHLLQWSRWEFDCLWVGCPGERSLRPGDRWLWRLCCSTWYVSWHFKLYYLSFSVSSIWTLTHLAFEGNPETKQTFAQKCATKKKTLTKKVDEEVKMVGEIRKAKEKQDVEVREAAREKIIHPWMRVWNKAPNLPSRI